jgi:activating signal cointegrator complex subunit 1
MSNFTTSLLAATPPISGLDESIIIPSRRLHFTLGVMSLESTATPNSSAGSLQRPTLQAAIALLQSLKPHIDDILAKPPHVPEFPPDSNSYQKLRVALNIMDVMKLEKDDMAHVVWTGPAEGNSRNATHWETKRFRDVCG